MRFNRRFTYSILALPILFAALAILLVAQALAGDEKQQPAEFGTYPGYSSHPYKGVSTQSLYINMRDGVKIATDVMLPKDMPAGSKIPAIVKITRYWRAVEYRPPISWFRGPDEFQWFFVRNGYALVLVDARGSGASFGVRPHPWSKDEIMDGGEIVNWIVAQPWSNGKVGAIGISYSGTSAEFLAVPNHPAVKAVIPQFADHDIYKDIAFPGGIMPEWFIKNWAYFNHHLDSNTVPPELGLSTRLFVRGVKPVDNDRGRRLLKQAILEHANNSNVYELAKGNTYRDDPDSSTGLTIDDFSPHNYREEIERSGVAIFSWGSWMDETQADAVIRRFLTYSNLQKGVIGPWSHGGGDHASPYLSPDTPTDPDKEGQWLECLRFFDYYLKDSEDGVKPERALIYYTMGEEKWKSTAVWPPVGSSTRRLYMAPDNTLSPNSTAEESAVDTYAVDFGATTGSANRWHTQMGGDVIYPDRAKEDSRLLTYTSAPLTEDTEITGYPVITLYASSTCSDGAFFVYLEEVDETGKCTYISEGELRALHRKISNETPPYKILVPYHSFKRKEGMPLKPGEVAKLSFGLHPTSVLVKKGHRVRIAIAGHDKDTFVRIPAECDPLISVARNKAYASYIDLPVIIRNK